MVFVLDRHKKPLMPCSPKRARLLLARKRAVVHRISPFVIRLKDRRVEESRLQAVALKIDPGSKTTGMAIVRQEATQDGPHDHALHLAEVRHRGTAVHQAMLERAGHRRRRRSTNLRYREPRFDHRTRPRGWLLPSLDSRVGNVLNWTRRYGRWVPVRRIEVERVTFDSQLLQNAEISGLEYQRGELTGWETRAYLLEKFGHRCAYCGKGEVPFELDHQLPRSRGGSNRVSNLVLACHDCNSAKGNRTAAEFGYPQVQAQAQAPLRDASAVNATRLRAGARAREAGAAHRHLERRAHALEPGALRSPQNARPGRALRRRSCRDRCGQSQDDGHHGDGERTLWSHQQ